MSLALALSAVLLASLLLQARLPGARLLVVLLGAALSITIATLGGLGSASSMLADVPWDVLVILVALGLMSELFVEARLFSVLAVRAATASRATALGIALVFGSAMYLTSALMNNLTALVLVLPVVLVLFRVIGVTRRQAAWTMGFLLVACNLGGAATPIGDFPAILLLGRGSMSFGDYLRHALPATFVGLVVFGALACAVVRRSAVHQDAISASISLALIRALYRGAALERRLFIPLSVTFCAMLLTWSFAPRDWGLGAEHVAWLGVGVALALRPKLGERLLRTRVDVESVLFLLGLFVMVVAVRRTGVFSEAASLLVSLPIPAEAQLVVFLVVSGLLTGVFSAGPSMAALLEVAQVLATRLPGQIVYVGLALSVCAGSSLFLTAATAGPLAQSLTERAGIVDERGAPLRFGFADYLPVGLVGYAVIQLLAVGYALWGLASS